MFKGIYSVQHWRKGKLINNQEVINQIFASGKEQFIRNVFFDLNGQTPANKWVMTLVTQANVNFINYDEYISNSNAHLPWNSGTPDNPGNLASSGVNNFTINNAGNNTNIKALYIYNIQSGNVWSVVDFIKNFIVLQSDVVKCEYAIISPN